MSELKWMPKGEIPTEAGWYWRTKKPLHSDSDKIVLVELYPPQLAEPSRLYVRIEGETEQESQALEEYRPEICPHCKKFIIPSDELFQFAGPIPKPVD